MATQRILEDQHLRQLALAVARNRVGPNDPIDECIARECVSPQEFEKILDDPIFKRYVNAYVKDLTDNGFSFMAKARVLAEDLLPHFYHLAKDVDTPAPARVKIMENMVEWGNLAPKQTPEQQVAAGTGFHITFNIPTLPAALQQAAVTIDNPSQAAFSATFTPAPSVEEVEEEIQEVVARKVAHDPANGADPWGGLSPAMPGVPLGAAK